MNMEYPKNDAKKPKHRPAPLKTFQCHGFGECRMVFSRSEHLARHVRKHTGERPFPCHCGKQFSRIDNLRQHAQTVHSDAPALNERMMRELVILHATMNKGRRLRAGQHGIQMGLEYDPEMGVTVYDYDRPPSQSPVFFDLRTPPNSAGPFGTQMNAPPPPEYFQQSGYNDNNNNNWEQPPIKMEVESGWAPTLQPIQWTPPEYTIELARIKREQMLLSLARQRVEADLFNAQMNHAYGADGFA